MQQATSNNAGEKTSARTLSYEGATTIGKKIMPEAAKLFAARTGVTADAAGQATAQQLFARLPPGQYFKTLTGAWVRK